MSNQKPEIILVSDGSESNQPAQAHDLEKLEIVGRKGPKSRKLHRNNMIEKAAEAFPDRKSNESAVGSLRELSRLVEEDDDQFPTKNGIAIAIGPSTYPQGVSLHKVNEDRIEEF